MPARIFIIEKTIFIFANRMDWDDIRIFLAVIELRSLSAAAAELGLSVATVGRRLDSLEDSLDLKLLHRSNSGTEPTIEGSKIVAVARGAAGGIYQLERLAASLRESADVEPVSISCTETIAADVLAPALPALQRQYPNLRLHIDVANENVSLARRQADLSIRLARPTEESLVTRKLPAIPLGLYAAPSYLAGRAPQSLALERESLLGYSLSYRNLPESQWFTERGLDAAVRMRASSVRTLLNAVRCGCGIALLPEYLARQAGLVPIAVRGIPTRQPYLVFHRDLRNVKRVKTVRQWVFDALESALSA